MTSAQQPYPSALCWMVQLLSPYHSLFFFFFPQRSTVCHLERGTIWGFLSSCLCLEHLFPPRACEARFRLHLQAQQEFLLCLKMLFCGNNGRCTLEFYLKSSAWVWGAGAGSGQ